ncbi:MAG: hypothetical protein JWO67_753 [Streptosporangiaceae bacterium]|nr:hypothetical protein [Streptosporangiaceae bacterium]
MPVRFTVPVVLVSRTVTGEDSFGNDVYGPVESTVDGIFAPGGSTEQVQGQDVVTTQPTVYLRTGTSVAAVDALRISGVIYEVDGQPNAWPPNPYSGWQPEFSVEVKLRRVTG